MALHGGIERETDRIAHRVAGASGASLYAVTQPGELRWHIPSVRCSPEQSPALRAFLDHVSAVVSIHGFGRTHLSRSVLVGGTNQALVEAVATAVREHTTLRVLDKPEEIPRALRGRHPRNPVNLARLGGVQLELSQAARASPELEGLVAAVAAVVASASPDRRPRRSYTRRP